MVAGVYICAWSGQNAGFPHLEPMIFPTDLHGILLRMEPCHFSVQIPWRWTNPTERASPRGEVRVSPSFSFKSLKPPCFEELEASLGIVSVRIVSAVVTIKLSSNKCIASSNKCLTSSNKKLLETSASLLVTSALLVVTRSY